MLIDHGIQISIDGRKSNQIFRDYKSLVCVPKLMSRLTIAPCITSIQSINNNTTIDQMHEILCIPNIFNPMSVFVFSSTALPSYQQHIDIDGFVIPYAINDIRYVNYSVVGSRKY
jgi:hypothetical protein